MWVAVWRQVAEVRLQANVALKAFREGQQAAERKAALLQQEVASHLSYDFCNSILNHQRVVETLCCRSVVVLFNTQAIGIIK